jgi:hypothetical protein
MPDGKIDNSEIIEKVKITEKTKINDYPPPNIFSHHC